MSETITKEMQEEADKNFALQLQEEFNREAMPESRRKKERANAERAESKLKGVIECSTCRTKNAIPPQKADAYLCGVCNKQLKEHTSQTTTSAPSSIPASTTKEKMISLQVQCGECSAVNEVQVQSNATSVQFKCGDCQSINEAELS